VLPYGKGKEEMTERNILSSCTVSQEVTCCLWFSKCHCVQFIFL